MGFRITEPSGEKLPILISSPHSGTAFPEETRQDYAQMILNRPEDTDWFIDQLYAFAPEMGITLIAAEYSRFVIDLNRDPKGTALYSDGRPITELVPTKTFSGQDIHLNPLSDDEIQRRHQKYFIPYHQKIDEILQSLLSKNKNVLFFDAHSIKKELPGFPHSPFPDLILGDNQGNSCAPELSQSAIESLSSTDYSVSHNHPFQGGFLTRSKGQPQKGIHAMQLEMAQSCYMNLEQVDYQQARADKVQNLLRSLFQNLLVTLRGL